MGEIIKLSEDLIEEKGDKVLYNTLDCIIWTHEHSNCFGCPSQLACSKLAKFIKLRITHELYEPRSLEDYQEMNWQDELTTKILNAKTNEELDQIAI